MSIHFSFQVLEGVGVKPPNSKRKPSGKVSVNIYENGQLVEVKSDAPVQKAPLEQDKEDYKSDSVRKRKGKSKPKTKTPAK